MDNLNKLSVLIDDRPVGTLAMLDNRLVTFEYDANWIGEGFAISPFSLPLEKRVYIPRIDPFDGVFGVFADSLPDGWGRLLLDRHLVSLSINPASISELTRLGIVGDSGLGALTYAPSLQQAIDVAPFTLDELAQDAMGILTSGSTENLDTLFELGGSSGGARPKIMTVIDGQDWIIKFCSRLDSPDCGAREYTYSLCAKACGIDMSETRLFESDLTEGYFGTRRFDRTRCEDDSIRRIHTVSVSALLETSHRYPSLDYQSLMTLTRELTRDFSQVEQQFRRMCFNVYAHNRDDHAKNFAFQYYDGSWRLSPAYDLTYSNSIGGEHATSVNGNGKNPNDEDLISVAISAGLSKKRAVSIAEAIKGTVFEMLGMVHTGLC